MYNDAPFLSDSVLASYAADMVHARVPVCMRLVCLFLMHLRDSRNKVAMESKRFLGLMSVESNYSDTHMNAMVEQVNLPTASVLF